MSDAGRIKDLAKRVYRQLDGDAGADNYFWNKVERIIGNIHSICRLPDIRKANPHIEDVIIAAYFLETGWLVNEKKISGKKSIQPANDFSLSAEIAADNLKETLDADRVKKIAWIIEESGNNNTNLTEAMVLSDARNLEDMGTVGLFNQFRMNAFAHKSVCDVLKSWKRKVDYKYWDARLKEGFHFPSVRMIASNRLHKASIFMQYLKEEHERMDLDPEEGIRYRIS